MLLLVPPTLYLHLFLTQVHLRGLQALWKVGDSQQRLRPQQSCEVVTIAI